MGFLVQVRNDPQMIGNHLISVRESDSYAWLQLNVGSSGWKNQKEMMDSTIWDKDTVMNTILPDLESIVIPNVKYGEYHYISLVNIVEATSCTLTGSAIEDQSVYIRGWVDLYQNEIEADEFECGFLI